MPPYDPEVLVAKLVADAIAVGFSVGGAVLAVGESQPLTYGALGATLVFTGLLVRQVTANQKVYVRIVAAKDYELALKDWQHARERWDDAERLHEARWEAERLRYVHGERQVDPGPYIPRLRPAYLDTPPPRPGAIPE